MCKSVAQPLVIESLCYAIENTVETRLLPLSLSVRQQEHIHRTSTNRLSTHLVPLSALKSSSPGAVAVGEGGRGTFAALDAGVSKK